MSSVQFAVVREDPRIEGHVVQERRAKRALVVASGGCTALSLAALFPDLHVTAVDANPAQLDHVRAKHAALARGDRSHFNIEADDREHLNQCGNFESLFRSLRRFITEFVAAPQDITRLFEDRSALENVGTTLFAPPYWPVAFELFFGDNILETMFGPDATQHAQPGSYPRYFQAAFERGLRAPDAFDNYFLHHVLLGHYVDRPDALPAYLTAPARPTPPEFVLGRIEDTPGLGEFDVVSLSNVMDWMEPSAVRTMIDALVKRIAPGATVIYRQLNNARDLEAQFGPSITFDHELATTLHKRDRSLFYSSLHIGTRSTS